MAEADTNLASMRTDEECKRCFMHFNILITIKTLNKNCKQSSHIFYDYALAISSSFRHDH